MKDRNWIRSKIKTLYEKNEAGCIAFVPGKGHTLIPLSREKPALPQIDQKCAVTYTLSGGRLGDNLLSYLHAKWIAHQYQIPLIQVPFPRCEEFSLSLIPQPAVINSPVETIPYFPEPSMKNNHPPFFVDWDDHDFRQEIAACLKPTRAHALLKLPSDRITVCVHIRRGGSFDSPFLSLEYPLKFPPDSYYLQQIETVAHIFQGQPLYLFLMTDDLHPEKTMALYRKTIPNPNIEWDCRKTPPSDDLDDFFSIPLFDCLIHPDSNFSIVASKLTEYAIKIHPTHYKKKKEKALITGVKISFNPEYRLYPNKMKS
ncbi:MAG: hypothetical protein KGI80_05740 [Verrucomicrobiota bacterium]|nr:hypothetical protein [Verrucomicrobiota bacterium]